MKKKVLLIGAGSYAGFIIKELKKYNKYEIVSILDDNINLRNKSIDGIKITVGISNINLILEKIKLDLVIVAISNLEDEKKQFIMRECKQRDVAIRFMPSIENILTNSFKAEQLDNSELSKLLNRPIFDIKNNEIEKLIKDRIVLVTGGGGSIGSEICRQIIKMNPKKLIILDIYENTTYELKVELNKKFKEKIEVVIMSVLDKLRLERIFELYKPEIVFHAAAYKHVPLMENSPVEAIKNNIFGTLNVATLADKFNVEKFILISTDKAVNPTNTMGASKRFCEMIVTALNRESNTKFISVRFGNVLGSNGSVIPLFRKQIKEGGPVTLTHKDITRYFMLIPEAVNLVLHAAILSDGGEVFILDMGEPIKIKELAEKLIEYHNLRPGIDIDIKEIGLRAGEKLHEELIINKDKIRYTSHKKIFIEECEEIDIRYIYKCVEYLINMCQVYKNNLELKKALSYVVQSYNVIDSE